MTMSGEEEEEYKDLRHLLRSFNANTNLANADIDNNATTSHHTDLEAQDSLVTVHMSPRSYQVSPVGFKDLLIKYLDRSFSSFRHLSFKRYDRDFDRSSTSIHIKMCYCRDDAWLARNTGSDKAVYFFEWARI